jgi:hypothetical protein
MLNFTNLGKSIGIRDTGISVGLPEPDVSINEENIVWLRRIGSNVDDFCLNGEVDGHVSKLAAYSCITASTAF